MQNVRIENKRRLFITLLLIGAVFTALAARLVYLQIIDAPRLQKMALQQWTRDLPVAAKRGRILDRNQHVLAQSGIADTVVVQPGNVKDAQKVAAELSRILGLEYETVLQKVQDKTRSETTIKRQIDPEQSDEIRSQNLKGVAFTLDTRRFYPMKSLLSQVIGYTRIDGAGQEGMEEKQDKYLAGSNGKLVAEMDSRGREIPFGAEQFIPPEDGCDVILTIDAVMQTFLEKALDEALAVNNAKNVQGIIMNPKTGEVIAMATRPGFDLNAPPRNDLELLRSGSRNSVICDSYEPGSTFKVVTLASGLDSGAITVNSEFDCPGYKIVDGTRISCWSRNPHLHQVLAEGVQHSCNPVFMTIAEKMGKDIFYDYIYKFGFGESTGVGLTGETKGIVTHLKYIKNVDIACIGFGQSIAITPIQLASAVCAAVNGGEYMQPYIVKEIVAPSGQVIESNEPKVLRRVIKEETSAIVRDLLEGVVKEGSGKNAYIPGYRIGGKTGTAQKSVGGVQSHDKLIASFVGIAPIDDPQLVVLILVDEPNVYQVFGSTVAAPFVRDILSDAFKYMKIPPKYTAEELKLNMEVIVPDVSGMTVEEARKEMNSAGLLLNANGNGRVINQVPQAGAKIPEKSTILIYMSEQVDDNPVLEDNKVEVPNVIGMDAVAAYDKLLEVGLNIKQLGDTSGEAVMQSPSAGTIVEKGTRIAVNFDVK